MKNWLKYGQCCENIPKQEFFVRAFGSDIGCVAPSVVHPNPAKFMKGRKIEDQVKLAKYLLGYAKAAEEDGVIVALDKEKAYDRINHAYLLRVLQHMGFPPKFCNTIKSLYTNAETIVRINGEMSEPFIVTCGVRPPGLISFWVKYPINRRDVALDAYVRF